MGIDAAAERMDTRASWNFMIMMIFWVWYLLQIMFLKIMRLPSNLFLLGQYLMECTFTVFFVILIHSCRWRWIRGKWPVYKSFSRFFRSLYCRTSHSESWNDHQVNLVGAISHEIHLHLLLCALALRFIRGVSSYIHGIWPVYKSFHAFFRSLCCRTSHSESWKDS